MRGGVELPSLDWSSAKVKDGKLTVDLTGERPKGWKKSFDRTAALLGRGDWAEAECKRGKVTVSGLEPGGEEGLPRGSDRAGERRSPPR
jgi:hypothetical protein